MFYKISHSTDPNVIGAFPVTGDYIGYHDYNSPNSYTRILWGATNAENFSIPDFFFERKAKITDIIRGPSASFLFVNDRTLKKMLLLNLDENQIFKTYFYKKNVNYLYNLVYLYSDRSAECIDWGKTTFLHCRRLGNEIISTLRFPDFISYDNTKKKMFQEHSMKEEIAIDKLFFKESAIPFDLFRISAASPGYFCSEKLKNEFITARITGIDFVPVEAINRFTLG